MTKIDPSLYLYNQKTERTPSPELGKNDFLQILMTQLQNQDPSNPMKDTEFISQMANFSSLEQMMNMTSSIDKLIQNQSVSPILQYSHMIGKEVSYQLRDQETGDALPVKEGDIIAVSQKNGEAILELASGEKITASSIVKVSLPESETAGSG